MNIQTFAKHPNDYVLFIDKNGDVKSRKKGLATWLQAHIFNRKSYKLKNIINKLDFTKLDPLEKTAIDNKITHYYQAKGIKAQPVIDAWAKFNHTIVQTHPSPSLSNVAQPNPIEHTHPVEHTQLHKSQQPAITSPSPLQAEFQKSDFYHWLNNTSDHTWKTFSVTNTITGAKPLKAKVCTWNLMNRCTKTVIDPKGKVQFHCNNPIGKHESNDEYKLRKRVQFEEIRSLITDGKGGKIDSMVLQEINFYSFGRILKHKIDGEKIQESDLKPEEKVELELYREFIQMVEDCGWKLLASPPFQTNNIKAQPILILYNANKLEAPAKQKFLTPCFLQNDKYRGGEVIFTDKATGQKLAVTGLHLDYDANTQQDVETYQKEKIAADIPTIAVGDLNTTLNKEMKGQKIASAIIDWNHPTNVDASGVDDNGDKDPNTLTLKDNQNANLNKAYDAAFVNPSQNGKAKIVEEEMQYFVMKNGSLKVNVKNLKQPHQTNIGQAWKKGSYKFSF